MGRTKDGARGVSGLVERRLAMIEVCEQRGESLSAYAARTGQSARALYEAKRAARRAGLLAPTGSDSGRRKAGRRGAPRFVEAVASRRSSDREPTSCGIVWRLRFPGGAVLESTTPLDVSLLGQLMDGAEGRS